MVFVENLAAFFGPDDPGVVAALYDGASTVYGEFRADYIPTLGDYVEGTAPHFWCAAADVSGVAHGKTLVIGATTYKVRGVEPDGTGVVTLRLEKQ